MADLGFLPVVTRILDKTPSGGQRLLFSATLDNGVDKLVRRFLHNEVLHSVDEANSPVAAMTHHVFETESVESKRVLVEKLASGTGRRILFMRTKHHAKKLAKQLTAAGIPAVDLHGNLSQVARDRNLAAFSDGSVRVLVATDVAARGVHVDDIELVIHVDPPAEHKAYLHRSGRTARAGSEGDVVTIMLPAQRKDVKDLLRKAAITVTPEVVPASAESASVDALVGEVAAYVKPEPKAAPVQGGGGASQGANAQRKRARRGGGGQGGGSGAAAGAGDGSGAGRGSRGASAGGEGGDARNGGGRGRGGQGGNGGGSGRGRGRGGDGSATGGSRGGRGGQGGGSTSGGSRSFYSTSSDGSSSGSAGGGRRGGHGGGATAGGDRPRRSAAAFSAGSDGGRRRSR